MATAAIRPRHATAIDHLARRHHLHWGELVPWVIAIAAYWVFPGYLGLSSQIMIMILFALSLDLILGYAGIVTLGHSALFGMGAYTAGILAVHVWNEPLSGLVAAAVTASGLGLVSGLIILRTHGLTLLMLTLAIVFMVMEAANKASWLTGGSDGLSGISMKPVLGLYRFDLFGHTAYWYCLAILFLGWVFVRTLVHSPFGRSLTGIRENVTRMHAIGSPVDRRLLIAYTIAAGLAGVAGALQAQTTQFVALNVVGFELSGAIVIMLVLGGTGRLYGAFVGAPLYMILQDYLAKLDTTYWLFWIGLLLVVVVMFARGGVLGLADQVLARARRLRK
jgi:branched-chain amino acid transport system permease protein